ncbi:MAG TPA: sugar nucleotide-binding protein [Patescibacteria group bacterium]|nr:sugar nucleotide-binding protein [Patescibacteria group bacterium]
MKRILITGGSSYLGRHLVPIASKHFQLCYTYFQHDPLDLPSGRYLDLCDEAQFYEVATEFQPQVIIQLAGSNRGANMEEIIHGTAQNATTIARSLGIKLIHISTDSLLDGQHPPYFESHRPTPITAYGRAKAEAERLVGQWADHVIIRTSLIYGLTIMDHSTRWIRNTLNLGKPVTLYDNQIRQPVWAETLSQVCLELVESNFQGIINIAGRQAMSRAEFGLKLLDWWGVTNREYLTIGPADIRWPLDCRLDLTLAGRILSTPLPGLDDVLVARRQREDGDLLV